MRKRYLIFASICMITAVCVLAAVVINHKDREVQQEEVESVRDQLKVFQTDDEIDLLQETISIDIETDKTIIQTPEPEEAQTVTETQAEIKPEDTASIKTETEPELLKDEINKAKKENMKVPVLTLDFESMWETNTDICAWIEIEGTKVDYPILQSPTDDNKYLTTAVDGSYYIGGSIFTQATYNSKDFNDPVTLIYGHTMRSGTLFGQLQSIYSSANGFEDCCEIHLYLPEEVRKYTVFAAVPYSNIHIPATYDFSKEYWYKNFFEGIYNIRELGVQFNKEIIPEYGDRVIILSTCMNEDSTRRYLVMAIYQDDIG